ncbi:MAG TPA: hypothetical protein VKR22_08575 [Acidimicrobiales bacterium]|nr:hypothetical protein [Acidimicrobiales bacterium]
MGPRQWGSVARKGARVLGEDPTAARRGTEPIRNRPPVRHTEEVWVFEGAVGAAEDERPGPRARRGAPPGPVAAAGSSATRPVRPPPEVPALPAEVTAELTAAVGRQQGAKLAERMAAAMRAYERDRYQDAWRISRLVAERAPESAAARELHGLVSYRLGRWREAIRHLEATRALSGDDPSQLPVLMDCHRALGHHRRVEGLWSELREASPDADVLTEGRLVYASDMADRGDLGSAVALLQTAGASRRLRHPAERHIRQWYVLADLFERAGDLPRARELFARVAEADPELADAPARLAALGRRGRARTSANARPRPRGQATAPR